MDEERNSECDYDIELDQTLGVWRFSCKEICVQLEMGIFKYTYSWGSVKGC